MDQRAAINAEEFQRAADMRRPHGGDFDLAVRTKGAGAELMAPAMSSPDWRTVDFLPYTRAIPKISPQPRAQGPVRHRRDQVFDAVAVDIRPEGSDAFVNIFARQVHASQKPNLALANIQQEQGRRFKRVAHDAMRIALIGSIGVEGDLSAAVHHQAGVGRRLKRQASHQPFLAPQHKITGAIDVENFEIVDRDGMGQGRDAVIAAQDVGAFDHGDAHQRRLRAIEPAGFISQGLSGAVGGDFYNLQVAVFEHDMPDRRLHRIADRPGWQTAQRDIDRHDIGKAGLAANKMIAGGIVEGVEIAIEQGILLRACQCSREAEQN